MTSSNRRPITRSITLSPQEDERLQTRASRTGMAVSPFIKRAALSGTIKVLDFLPLEQHTSAIGKISDDIRSAMLAPHPDRWLYQAELAQIEAKLSALLEIETDIQHQIRRRMK